MLDRNNAITVQFDFPFHSRAVYRNEMESVSSICNFLKTYTHSSRYMEFCTKEFSSQIP